ncbi:MAG TPA: methyltransferase domain-containing protein, partial [Bryobacteraceae bacterium]
MARLLQSLKQRMPDFLRPMARGIYYSLYRAGLRLQWRMLDRRSPPSATAAYPLPPARLRFRVAENTAVLDFFTVGMRTAEALREALARVAFPLQDGFAVLDFGCGCGRTLLWLARQFPQVRWHGTDVDAESIAWCSQSIPGGVFRVNGPLPPLPFPDESFDLIYGVSVFTHLSQRHQQAWLPELRRVLRPGGLMLASFHSKNVWQLLEDAPTIERDGFVFRTSAKLQGILPEWYQTAFQSQPSIISALAACFSEVEYLERHLGDQDIAVARKPGLDVVAAVILREGRILLCQRKRGGRHSLKWEFPGGKVESGEEPRAALARELREELDIEAVIGAEMDSYEIAYPDGFRAR